ncbi:MAG: copper chaperone PCu(A)C [Candidatus Puniceispirillaceae bacterium]
MFSKLKHRSFLAVMYGVLATMLVLPGSAFAADNACQQQGLHIAGAEIRATAPNAPVTGGYLHIHNEGDKAQRLISVHADFAPHIELHEMKHQDGVMKMAPLPNGITIAAGERIQLKPGGLHIMFMQLTEQLVPSQMHKAQLMFDGCGALPVMFMVVENPGKGHANGKGHAHGAADTHKHQH